MQAKMAGSSRLLRAFYRLYFGFWVPTLAWAATRWPLGLMYWMARWLVILPFAVVRPKYLRAVRGNYARILSLPASHRDVRSMAWRMMFEHAYHWIDFFRWAQRSAVEIRGNIAGIEGLEHFQRARASGQGTVLLAAHLGNPEVGAVAFGLENGPLHVLYWRDRFEVAEEFRARMRARGNVHGIPVDASPLSVVPALRALRECGVVAAHGDRDFNDQGWPVEFFGATAKFPPGPFLLAARAGALVVPTFFLLEADRRFRVFYEAPIAVGEGHEAAAAAQRSWVAILERRIREHPEQWYCFYPFWGGTSLLDRAVTRP